MKVLLAELTNVEEEQETSAVISKFRNAWKKIILASAFLPLFNLSVRHRVTPVPLVTRAVWQPVTETKK
jgi:hypothetical protein